MQTWINRLRRDRRGSAGLEMAVVTTFLLLPITAGTIGAGQAILEQYRVDRALHAALIWTWGAPSDLMATVQTAAQNGYGSAPPTMTATATSACFCISPTGTRATGISTTCGAACATNGYVNGKWVTVNIASTFTPIFTSTWGSAAAWAMSATGTVRVQ